VAAGGGLLRSTAVKQALHLRWILILCCLAQFMVILDVSVVNVALPSIRRDLGFSAVDLQWIVNAYTLTFAGFLLLGGRAADLLGHRRVFVGGLALFAFASLAGALSGDQLTLELARGAQGLGGAVVAPVTLSILTTTFPEGPERRRAMGAWGAIGGAGGAAGVLLGGILTDVFGWQSILLINVPIGLGIAWGALRFIPRGEPTPRAEHHYDALGAVVVTAGLIILTFAIVRTDVHGWSSASTLLTGGLGLALLAGFLVIEGRLAPRPLVPLHIFESRTLSVANIVVFFLGAAVFAMWYFVSLYLQQVLGLSPIRAGLAFLPMTFAIIIASTQVGRITQRFGARAVLTFGMALIAVGMVLFADVRPNGSYAIDVLGPGVLTALGLGMSFVPVTVVAMMGVEHAQAGLASGLVNTSRQFGGSLGLAVLATVASQTASGHGRSALTSGFHHAFLLGAAFAAVGAVAAAVGLGKARAVDVPGPAMAADRS
jgi:EmrB/QacA subfamily drug resistance transporter